MFENEFKIEDLCTGTFSDNLDRLGFKHQIASGFQRNQRLTRFIGRARTVMIELNDAADENLATGLKYFETLGKGDVIVVAGNGPYAYFGQMMSRLCMRQGIEGVVIDGMSRDSIFTNDKCILPIYSKGYTPVDIKGRGQVKAVDIPIIVDGIIVSPGDLVFADTDAVCFVPRVCEDELEKMVRKEIQEEKKRVALINNGASVDEILSSVDSF